MSDNDKKPIAPKSLLDLSGHLKDLPEDKFRAIIVELSPITETPEAIKLMNEARPRLRTLKMVRPVTVKRLLCKPFEDLLHSSADANQKLVDGQISRTAIEPCWQLLKDHIPDEMNAFQVEFRGYRPNEPDKMLSLCERLWATAAKALSDKTKVDSAAIPSLDLIAQILQNATTIEAYKRVVPAKPLKHIGEVEAEHLMTHVQQLQEKEIPLDGFLLVVCARMSSPIELLHFFRQNEIPLPVSIVNRLDGFAVQTATEKAEKFAKEKTSQGAEDVVRNAEALMNEFNLMRQTLTNPVAQKNMEKSALAAANNVRKAVLDQIIKPGSDVMGPAFDSPVDKETLLNAEAHARALNRARRLASQVGLEGAMNTTIADVRKKIETQLEKVLKAPGGSKDQTGPEAQKQAFQLVRMMELTLGAEAARPLLLQAQRKFKVGQPAPQGA